VALDLVSKRSAQLIAAHNAAMECYRRAMHSEQTFEGRRENLNQANKLSRSYAVLVEALNSPRARAGRKSRLSTSTSIPAVGPLWAWWRPRPLAILQNQRNDTVLNKLPMHLSRRCGARTRKGSRCQSPAMPNGRCRMHGGKSAGAPKGNKNALKHGRYTAEAMQRRRAIASLLRTMKALHRDLK
jgi:hypothetical protein